MLWVVSCFDKPNIEELRKAHTDAHNIYLNAKFEAGVLVLGGGAVGLDGKTRVGSLFIVNCKTGAEARAFYEAEPLTQAGVFASVTITGVKKNRWNPDAAANAEGRGQKVSR